MKVKLVASEQPTAKALLTDSEQRSVGCAFPVPWGRNVLGFPGKLLVLVDCEQS